MDINLKGKQWLDAVVEVLKEKDRPLTRKEITSLLKAKNRNKNPQEIYNFVGVVLFNAKKAGIISYTKIPPKKVGYYCNPTWLNEKGELKKEYQFDPFWD